MVIFHDYAIELRELSSKEKELIEELRRKQLLDAVEMLFLKGKPTKLGKTYLSTVSPISLIIIKQHDFNILFPRLKLGIINYRLIETIKKMLGAKSYDEFYVNAYSYMKYLTEYVSVLRTIKYKPLI